MTLIDIIRRIEAAAGRQPAVKSIVRRDIYRLNDIKDATYGVFGWTQGVHSTDLVSGLRSYQFTFFYIDRLAWNDVNTDEIQSVGMDVLDNIARELYEQGITANIVQHTPFTQRFADDCAGVFASVTISANVDGICADEYSEQNINIY